MKLSRILNCECVVWPSNKIDVATPNDAVVSTTNYLHMTAIRMILLYRNAFLVPPSPSIKNATLLDEKKF